jgi:GTPase
MCSGIGAQIAGIEERRVSRRPELYAAEIRVCLTAPQATTSRRTVKVAFVGDTDSGKSTLVGVLSGGALDDGKGSVRLSLLRHRHEVISGQTSSLAIEFLPFDDETKTPIRHDYDSLEPLPLAKQKQLLDADRVAQFLDLAGDVRYQKTTYSALTSWATPDWICVVVPATAEIESLRDWLTLVLGLEIPFFVVLSKTDLVDAATVLRYTTQIPEYITQLRQTLFGVSVPPYAVSLLRVSNVTGEGIETLTNHFYRLRPRRNVRLMNYLLDTFPDQNGLFCVEGVQSFPDVGTVLMGTVLHGTISVGSVAQVGPTATGDFISVILNSAHRMRLSTPTVFPGQLVSIAIEPTTAVAQIHKGSILAVTESNVTQLEMTNTIEADVIGCSAEQAATVTSADPVHGMLYWMGSRWTAQLTELQTFYGEMKLRASFLLVEAHASPLPGSRVIFVGPHFRIEGLVHLPLVAQ